MADILEMLMIISFGCSWPLNIVKAWKARTAKGTSVLFYILIVFGYIIGIISKFIKMSQGIKVPFYVLFFYFLNALMVSVGIVIYFRNKRLDAGAKEK